MIFQKDPYENFWLSVKVFPFFATMPTLAMRHPGKVLELLYSEPQVCPGILQKSFSSLIRRASQKLYDKINFFCFLFPFFFALYFSSLLSFFDPFSFSHLFPFAFFLLFSLFYFPSYVMNFIQWSSSDFKTTFIFDAGADEDQPSVSDMESELQTDKSVNGSEVRTSMDQRRGGQIGLNYI